MLQKRIDDQPSISPEMVREAQQILHQHLKRVGLKHTAQRDTILRTFLETREHLSINELHRLVQKKDASLNVCIPGKGLACCESPPVVARSSIVLPAPGAPDTQSTRHPSPSLGAAVKNLRYSSVVSAQ